MRGVLSDGEFVDVQRVPQESIRKGGRIPVQTKPKYTQKGRCPQVTVTEDTVHLQRT